MLACIEAALSTASVGIVAHSAKALESGWVETETRTMVRRQAAGGMKLLALILEPDCPLFPGVQWDRVITIESSADLTGLAKRVAAAIRDLISPY